MRFVTRLHYLPFYSLNYNAGPHSRLPHKASAHKMPLHRVPLVTPSNFCTGHLLFSNLLSIFIRALTHHTPHTAGTRAAWQPAKPAGFPSFLAAFLPLLPGHASPTLRPLYPWDVFCTRRWDRSTTAPSMQPPLTRESRDTPRLLLACLPWVRAGLTGGALGRTKAGHPPQTPRRVTSDSEGGGTFQEGIPRNGGRTCLTARCLAMVKTLLHYCLAFYFLVCFAFLPGAGKKRKTSPLLHSPPTVS